MKTSTISIISSLLLVNSIFMGCSDEIKPHKKNKVKTENWRKKLQAERDYLRNHRIEGYYSQLDDKTRLDLFQTKRLHTKQNEARLKDLIILVNQTDSLFIDTIISKSPIYNPSFGFNHNCAKIIEKNAQGAIIEILLKQIDCLNSSCDQSISFILKLNKKGSIESWSISENN